MSGRDPQPGPRGAPGRLPPPRSSERADDGGREPGRAVDPVADLLRRARECDYLTLLDLAGDPLADEVTRAAERIRRLLAEAAEARAHPQAALAEVSACVDDAEAVLRDPVRAAAYCGHQGPHRARTAAEAGSKAGA